MNAPSTTPVATPGRRTRTGCKTCRQRKLKCDEGKPTCGQCRKSNRDCIPSEGIAFRHAQNAGLSEGSNQLSSFYKYRQRFNNTYFVPIPPELTFIQVTDPYASTDHETVHHEPQHHPQQILHGISHYQYDVPPQHHPQYVDVAASSLKAMIDPSLEAGTTPELPKLEGEQMEGEHVPHGTDMAETDINETIMKALGTADEMPGRL